MTIDQKIRKGIALLDADGPLDWRRKITAAIRAKRFDLRSRKHCVLGELYGDYREGLDRLAIEGDGEAYGFTTNFTTNALDDGIITLTQTWVRLYRTAKKTKRPS